MTKTVMDSLRKIVSSEPMPGFRIRKELKNAGHGWISESAVTARVRDLRKIGLTVLCRKNGKYWEYSIPEER